MIDTVNLYGHYFIPDTEIYRIDWNNEFDMNSQGGHEEQTFVYRKKGETLRLKYYAAKEVISLEVSIPKFLYGNNLRMVTDSDIHRFFIKLESVLMNKFYACKYHDIQECAVTRMDVCYNFRVGGAVRDYVKAFSNIHIPKYSTCIYGSNETVQWKCKSKRMQFYDKEREVLAHGGGAELAEQARGILRFEANVRGRLLDKYSKYRWAGELLREDVAKSLLLYHLHRLGIDRMFTIKNDSEMARILEDTYGPVKTMELLGFIKYRELFGQDSLKKLSRSTYGRRMGHLTKLGLTPVFSDVELPPLDLSPLIA